MDQTRPPRLKLTEEILLAALEGLNARRQRVEACIDKVTRIVRSRGHDGLALVAPKRKRTLSLAGRQRMVEAQQRRWAAYRKAKESTIAEAATAKTVAPTRSAGSGTARVTRKATSGKPAKVPVKGTKPSVIAPETASD